MCKTPPHPAELPRSAQPPYSLSLIHGCSKSIVCNSLNAVHEGLAGEVLGVDVLRHLVAEIESVNVGLVEVDTSVPVWERAATCVGGGGGSM